MGVVTEVLEKVVGINWRTLAVPFVAFCNFFSVLLTKQYFFLEKRNIEICISVFGMWFCKQNISYFGWSMIFFFCFFYKHICPIFTFCLCRSCYGQGLPCFQYNLVLQRHVYMTISDLSHSLTHQGFIQEIFMSVRLHKNSIL